MRELNQPSLTASRGASMVPMMNNSSSEQELTLAETWRGIYKHKFIVLGVTVAVFAMVLLYTMFSPRVYESVARVQVDPNRSSTLGLDDMISAKLGATNSGEQILATEVRIIRSDTVAGYVIEALGLAKNPTFAGAKGAAEATGSDPMKMSPAMRERLINRFRGSLKVQVLPGTQIIEIRFQSTDPKLATDVVNTLVEKYMERTLQTRYEGVVQVSNWLSRQMEELQNRANESQQKLVEFQKSNDILGTDENDNIVIDRLKQLNQEATDAEADRIVKEAKYRLAATGNPELVASVAPSTALPILRQQEADLKAQLAQVSSKYGSGYPKVAELHAQMTKLEAEIDAEVRNVGKRLEEEYRSSEKTEASLRARFEEQKERAYKLNEHAVQYAVLKHDVDNGRELYDTLQLKLKMAGVTAGLSSGYISIVDRGQVPDRPILPKVPLNLAMGLMGGLIAGLIVAFWVESLDDTLSSTEELETVISLPVLAAVPMHRLPNGKGEAEENKAAPVAPLLATHPQSQSAEAIRGLRTALLLSSPDRPMKMIAVVSSLPAEGKTTISVNLGVAFAQRGESVLMIDADLRRSTMHDRFGLPYSPFGTSTVVTQGMDERAILTPLESMPNLKLMPAGPHPPNPAELLCSKRMVELLEQMTQKYDRVIIDTPPILSVADSLALAHLADGVVLVVRAGEARKRAVIRVRDLLFRSNSNLVGAVFNCVNLQLEHYYYTRGARYKLADKYYGSNEN
jgi:capsular exopolysaccharide synthesis family protein